MKRSLPYIAILICAVVVTMVLTSFKETKQQPTVFIIRFTPEELNVAYTALTKLPYEQSAALISSIQRQASEQAAAMQQQPKKDSTTKQNKKQ